jgi:hypothetical protein
MIFGGSNHAFNRSRREDAPGSRLKAKSEEYVKIFLRFGREPAKQVTE